jgi:hypothetical protein
VIAWSWFRKGTWRSGDVRGEPGSSGPDGDDVDAAVSDD